jgi:hypothetical protein
LNRAGTVRFTARAAIDPNREAVVAAADGRAAEEAAVVVEVLGAVAATATGIAGGTRAFSLLLCAVRFSEVRLFLRKSHVGSGGSVYTRSENAVDRFSQVSQSLSH